MGRNSSEDDVLMALEALETPPEVLEKYIRKKWAPARWRTSGDESNGAEIVKDSRKQEKMANKLKFI